MEAYIHYIYKITFLCGEHKNCYYLGKRSTVNKTDNGYVGSGLFTKYYFKKYGKINGVTYIKDILEYNVSKIENSKREKEIIGDLYKTDPLCMNLCEGGSGGKTYEWTEEHRKRQSELAKEMHLKNPNWGGEMTEEKKRNISKAMKGLFAGEKNPHYGVKVPEEQKKRQSEKMKGRKRIYREDGTWYLEKRTEQDISNTQNKVKVTESNASF